MLKLDNKTILITGGTGSFGRAFCDHLIRTHPEVELIRIFSRDEHKHHEMRTHLGDSKAPIEFWIGDVKDPASIESAARGVNVIIHAAAMKQVSVTEHNPFECFKTNIVGSQNLIRAAVANKVSRVVALSTDKAVNPISAYGASKLALEVLFLDADRRYGETCRFSAVRYGNIFGSKGSVVPLFLSLRDRTDNARRALPLTDPESTRFSISLQDSIDLVLFSLEHCPGGGVVLPRCPSYRLEDLANAVAPDMDKLVLGLRPGEKRHEVLYSSNEASRIICKDRFFIIAPETGRWSVEDYHELEASLPDNRSAEFRSDRNELWLDVCALRKLVEQHEKHIH